MAGSNGAEPVTCCVCGADVTGLVQSACAEESVGILSRTRESISVIVTHTAEGGAEHTCSYNCPDSV